MREKHIQKHRIKKGLKYVFTTLCLAILCAVAMPAEQGMAADGEQIRVIHEFEDFFIFAQASQSYDYEGVTVQLADDIDLTQQAVKDMLEKYNVQHLTVGTKERPFKGTFDGQNHYIKGLVYEPGIIKDPNSGLFSFTENATIKNLTLENADIESVYQGGIVVGHAKNTRLENLTVVNSKIKISPANNIVSLITNLGFCGGGIAGIMEDSVMYNCEISGTEVVNNSTAGVTGVGGEGLYMGGLVGWAEDSTIEYSRVRSNYVGESGSQVVKESKIRNQYDIAVGALGGKSLYAGGIAGGVNTDDGETKIIDCFSTADVYFYAANYVAVGSGIAGYGGGITGALRGNSHIERCHYAGNIHSKQYNAILVIPIIQNDVNISGLSNINGGSSSVNDSYFKRSSSKTTKSLKAVGTENDTEQYSAQTDQTYVDIDFWKAHGYDFLGDIERTSKYSESHVNKWVMDYDLGIPVHGSSVYASFDFPGAGEVSIDETALVNTGVSTSDPYQFAAQGIHPRGDQQVTVRVKPTDSDPDDEIDEYQFNGWFRKEKVEQDYVSDIAELEAITHAEGAAPDSKDLDYTIEYKDNEVDRRLYTACLKARVAFYDIGGTEISAKTDYYTYRQLLPEVVPEEIPEGAAFYGWTTVPNENGGGYPAITSVELEKLQKEGAVYQAGDPVEKSMKLYPIFTSYITNIKTIFEGHDPELETVRTGVGHTTVSADEQGVYIEVIGEAENGAFPEGYQFLGWYEQIQEGETLSEYRVSAETKYYVPDVSKESTYIARFLYEVKCYASQKDHKNENNEYDYWNFYTDWVKYDHIFDGEYLAELMPVDHDHDFNHWSLERNGIGGCGNKSDAIPEGYTIVKPIEVFGHWTGSSTWQVALYSDFPNAAALTMESYLEYDLTFQAEPKPGYQFLFWAEEREKGINNVWTSNESRWKSGTHSSTEKYRVEAHLAAEVNFHDKTDAMTDLPDTKTVLRRYQDPVFLAENSVYMDYTYPFSKEKITVEYAKVERAASPSLDEMQVRDSDKNVDEHYEFLGWIKARNPQGHEKDGIEIGGKEWNALYDVEGDQYCTSNASKAIPYLLDENAVVGETMDLYPVYVKYDVTTTTNIHEMQTLPEGIQYPSKPAYSLKQDESTGQKGVAEVTITALTKTEMVRENEETTYDLVGMKCIQGDGTVVDLWPDAILDESGTSYTFKMKIDGGMPYIFEAIYNPAFVVYHLDGENSPDSTKLETRNVGQQVGHLATVNYDKIVQPELKNSYMIGWTEQKPLEDKGWYHYYASRNELESANVPFVTSKTIVQNSMDLWPVFCGISAVAESNIDTVIQANGDDPGTVRFIAAEANTFSLTAKEYPGYAFKGWYKNYQSNENKGDLLTESREYVLTEKELLSQEKNVFTAVYSDALDIRYHDFDGNIIYTAKTTADEKRTFVQPDPNDDKKMVPIDIEAFELILERVRNMEAESGTDIEFIEWRCIDGENQSYISWDEFKDQTITNSMDLYPVAYEVGFYDPEDQPYDGIYYTVQKTEKGEKEINALFTKEYSHPTLKIAAKELIWDPFAAERKSIGIADIRTSVYMSGEPDEQGAPTYVSASEGTVLTDENGEAVHNLFGRLIIRKTYGPLKMDGVVVVCVEKLDDAGSPTGQVLKVPISVKDGKGEVLMKLPIGNYRVCEDMGWSWRDAIAGVTWNGQEMTGFDLAGTTDVPINVLQSQVIVYGNTRENQKWFTDFCEKKNVFGKGMPAGGNIQ